MKEKMSRKLLLQEELWREEEEEERKLKEESEERLSELEHSEGVSASSRPEPKQDKKKKAEKAEVTSPSSDRRDSSLHVEDLDDSPHSPAPDSHGSMDEFRHYISSHGASIHKAKLFLERESSRLMERQAALRAAQTSSSQDPDQDGGVTEEVIRTLQQSTTNYAAFPAPQHHSSTSASVLHQMHTLSSSSSAPAPPVRLSEPYWNWAPQGSSTATPFFSTPVSSGLRASEDLFNSRWSQIFPRAAMDPIASSTMGSTSAYSSYTPASEDGRSLRSVQKSAEVDGQRLQGLIDGHKRWLEMRKKDTSIPLFTRYSASPTKSSLVQLGLDDNNQITVHDY
ncbi:hypothetical protein VZT92_020431 [Zoarces viviparus]|uniref:Uncharacterized protein n=1 Tax=Zoarces viviparus TaxID=48416 RepID=A0AAW1EEB8_ZOAVI